MYTCPVCFGDSYLVTRFYQTIPHVVFNGAIDGACVVIFCGLIFHKICAQGTPSIVAYGLGGEECANQELI